MTYRELWTQLTPLYDEGEAKAIVRLVAERSFGLGHADLLCGALDRLASSEATRLQTLMARLREAEPVQYVLGEAEFCGRMFQVEPGVLIPRPETELLCQWVCDTVGQARGLSLLDVGTGSGCIAATLALELPDCQVTAWDISENALQVAHLNAHRLGAHMTVEEADALHPPHDERRWDIIVSNPPYITSSERSSMHENVLRYEPEMALFVLDDDPQCFYRAIATYAWEHLQPGGLLFFECSSWHIHETARLLSAMGFEAVETLDDQFGKARHVRISRP